MIRQPRDWGTVQGRDGTDTMEQVTPGGHICRIISAETGKSKSQQDMLILCLEIDEGGQFDGVYRRMYDSRLRNAQGGQAVRWPCMYYQMINDYQHPENTNPRFKGLVRAVEESNPGFMWRWEERDLINRRVGMIFREEEYEGNDGTVRTNVKPFACFAAHKIAEIAVPAKKTLTNSPTAASAPAQGNGFQEVQDDELPFD